MGERKANRTRPRGRLRGPASALALAVILPLAVQGQDAVPVSQLPLTIDEAVSLAVEHSPRLAKAAYAVEGARGRALQASLRPNPVVSISGDELGDRTGAAGIWTAPRIEQELVTGKKRSLDMAAADREVARADLGTAIERLSLRTDVEARYLDAVSSIRRVEVLLHAMSAAEGFLTLVRRREAAKEAARLEVVLVETQIGKYRAEIDAARSDAANNLARLAVLVGPEHLQERPLAFLWEAPLPELDLNKALQVAAAEHPEVKAAQADLQRTQVLLERAKAEAVPNVTLSTGYTRQNQNRSHDWLIGVSAPLPAWNRNQGNVAAAKASVGESAQEVARARTDVSDRITTAYRDFTSAKIRAERYRATVLPRAQEMYDLSTKAYQAGHLDFDKLFEAQRAIFDARLEQLRAATEAWKAASSLASLTSMAP